MRGFIGNRSDDAVRRVRSNEVLHFGKAPLQCFVSENRISESWDCVAVPIGFKSPSEAIENPLGEIRSCPAN